jgi:hypothetical protein
MKKGGLWNTIVKSDRLRYGNLIEEIEKDFLKGHVDYSKTPMEAYYVLVNYQNYGNLNKRTATQGGLDQVTFVTEGKCTKPNGETVRFPHIKCFKCVEFGHYKSDCPKNRSSEVSKTTEMEMETTLTTFYTTFYVALAGMKMEIDPLWFLCDNE